MAQLIYKLWYDGAIVGEWNNPYEMYTDVREYVEGNPDQLATLRLTTFTSSYRTGAIPASSIQGEDIITFLEDIEAAE